MERKLSNLKLRFHLPPSSTRSCRFYHIFTEPHHERMTGSSTPREEVWDQDRTRGGGWSDLLLPSARQCASVAAGSGSGDQTWLSPVKVPSWTSTC